MEKTQTLSFLLIGKIAQFNMTPPGPVSIINQDDSFKLKCVYGDAGKTFTWFKWDGNQTNRPVVIPRYKISKENSPGKSVEVYHIRKAILSDQSIYICTVKETCPTWINGNMHVLRVKSKSK